MTEPVNLGATVLTSGAGPPAGATGLTAGATVPPTGATGLTAGATVPPTGATVLTAGATVPPGGATVLTPGATVVTPGATVLTSGATALPLGQLPICDIVDLLLVALVRHKASAVTIEPAGPGHAIRYERGTSTVTLDTLTPERGDAVVMRLAIIFGIAVGAAEEQIGRLRIRGRRRGSDPDLPAPPATEILVAVRPTASGLSAELHRFAGPEDEVAGGELVPAASDSGPEGNRRIGPYRLSSELGRGSMGIVYRAEHLVLQKAVAIKILHPGMAGDPEAAARFIMEARAACRARHPGIVDVTDFGRLPGGRAFLVMELVEGPTLDVVLQSGPLAAARAIRIAAAVAEALRAASAHCVVHRELYF